jgi:hypothetical protein
MDSRSKVTLSCGVALFLLAAGVITLFVMFTMSLKSDPVKGWQEGPHTPGPTLKVSVSPEPSTGH